MNILLVNPNTMKEPPVIPIGLEYLTGSLRRSGHRVDVLDLCFEKNPKERLVRVLNQDNYDYVGITIRNIDTSLYFNNEFFLPAIKELVQVIKEKGLKVVLGGAGFSAMPKHILGYMNADYGVEGPGEIAFPRLLRDVDNGITRKTLYDGHELGIDIHATHTRGCYIDYSSYFQTGGVGGIQTQSGCNGNCPYCLEAGKKVWFREITSIIEELRMMVDDGYDTFHLCDSEFNNDLDYCIAFLKALINEDLPMKWALYMKPSPSSKKLFQLLQNSGAYLVTLTVDTFERIQKMNGYNYDLLADIIDWCNEFGIKLAIDLLTGFPGENKDSTTRGIEFFKQHRPSSVGLGYHFRVHDGTPLAAMIKNDVALQTCLTRPFGDGDDFLKPVFYNNLSHAFIKGLIGDDALFKISGEEAGVNYQQF